MDELLDGWSVGFFVFVDVVWSFCCFFVVVRVFYFWGKFRGLFNLF